MSHLAQREGAEFGVAGLMGRSPGFLEVRHGRLELAEIEDELAGSPAQISVDGQQPGAQVGRTALQKVPGETTLVEDGAEHGLRAQGIILPLGVVQDVLDMPDDRSVDPRRGAQRTQQPVGFGR